jgi:hypothetical protein
MEQLVLLLVVLIPLEASFVVEVVMKLLVKFVEVTHPSLHPSPPSLYRA